MVYMGSPEREEATFLLASSRYVLYLESNTASLILIIHWKDSSSSTDTRDPHRSLDEDGPLNSCFLGSATVLV